MIIWKGWGILGAIIPVIFIVLHNEFLGEDTIGWAFLTSAVPVWLLGRNFHARPGEVMIDPKTKQNFLVKPEHDLFWVELDYWGIILAVLGVAYLMPEGIAGVSKQVAWVMIAMIFFGRLGFGFYAKYLKKDQLEENYSPSQSRPSADTEILKEDKLSKFAKKPSVKKQLNTSEKAGQLTEAERKKKAFYAQMRKDRERDKNFQTSDHSKYFPGSISTVSPISEIEEEIIFEEE